MSPDVAAAGVPAVMRAAVVDQAGGVGVGQAPTPTLRPGEVLLKVMATALNRADLSQAAGNYPPPPGESEVLGLEAAGVLVAGDEEVMASAGVRLGGAYTALLPGGGYAEYVAVPAAMLIPVPEGWTWAEAASLPEAAFTAYLNLFMEARLQEGERLLVHGGASGVGSYAIMLAKRAGCTVYATAGGAEKCEACRRFGADLAVDRHARPFEEAVMEHTGGQGVDVILDIVGEAYLRANLDVLATGGRLVFIATLGGRRAQLDIRELMTRRLKLIGSTLRHRPLAEKLKVRQEFLARFGDDLAAGLLRPHVDRVYRLEEVAEAHAYMRENRNVGKVALLVDERAD
ncbi:MAG TPA: NAD(P)H-quinone oxidoreductase [Trueperaceae bacterium]|jgi:putative PIG3 family NAD(P)H quinone oxidoreductase